MNLYKGPSRAVLGPQSEQLQTTLYVFDIGLQNLFCNFLRMLGYFRMLNK